MVSALYDEPGFKGFSNVRFAFFCAMVMFGITWYMVLFKDKSVEILTAILGVDALTVIQYLGKRTIERKRYWNCKDEVEVEAGDDGEEHAE